MTPEQLKLYYQKLHQKHGDSPAAVQHISTQAQYARFMIFSRFIKRHESVLDLGCGLGDFLTFLRSNQYVGEYFGCDFVDEFIVRNQNKFNFDSNSQFMTLDLRSDSYPSGFDYVTMSGIFNNKLDSNESFLFSTINKAYAAANKAVIFNALSSYVEYQEKELFYIDPLAVFDFVKRNITPFVQLKHDYITKPDGFPYEFTIVMKKQGELP